MSKAWRRHVTALGRAALAKAAQERAEAYRLQTRRRIHTCASIRVSIRCRLFAISDSLRGSPFRRPAAYLLRARRFTQLIQ